MNQEFPVVMRLQPYKYNNTSTLKRILFLSFAQQKKFSLRLRYVLKIWRSSISENH